MWPLMTTWSFVIKDKQRCKSFWISSAFLTNSVRVACRNGWVGLTIAFLSSHAVPNDEINDFSKPTLAVEWESSNNCPDLWRINASASFWESTWLTVNKSCWYAGQKSSTNQICKAWLNGSPKLLRWVGWVISWCHQSSSGAIVPGEVCNNVLSNTVKAQIKRCATSGCLRPANLTNKCSSLLFNCVDRLLKWLTPLNKIPV